MTFNLKSGQTAAKIELGKSQFIVLKNNTKLEQLSGARKQAHSGVRKQEGLELMDTLQIPKTKPVSRNQTSMAITEISR